MEVSLTHFLLVVCLRKGFFLGSWIHYSRGAQPVVCVPLVVREGLPGVTRELAFFPKNLDSQLSSLRI